MTFERSAINARASGHHASAPHLSGHPHYAGPQSSAFASFANLFHRHLYCLCTDTARSTLSVSSSRKWNMLKCIHEYFSEYFYPRRIRESPRSGSIQHSDTDKSIQTDLMATTYGTSTVNIVALRASSLQNMFLGSRAKPPELAAEHFKRGSSLCNLVFRSYGESLTVWRRTSTHSFFIDRHPRWFSYRL